MKPQSKDYVNFTFILHVCVYQTSDFPLVQNLGGCAWILLGQTHLVRLAMACGQLRYLTDIPTT